MLVAERTISITGRDEKILRLPAAWNDKRFDAGQRVRLTYEDGIITVEPVEGAAP